MRAIFIATAALIFSAPATAQNVMDLPTDQAEQITVVASLATVKEDIALCETWYDMRMARGKKAPQFGDWFRSLDIPEPRRLRALLTCYAYAAGSQKMIDLNDR